MKTTPPPASRLIPTGHKVCTGRELAAALVNPRLSKEEARAWSADLRNARRQLKPLPGKWRAPAAVVIIRGGRGTFNPQRWLQAQGFANVKGLKVIEPK